VRTQVIHHDYVARLESRAQDVLDAVRGLFDFSVVMREPLPVGSSNASPRSVSEIDSSAHGNPRCRGASVYDAFYGEEFSFCFLQGYNAQAAVDAAAQVSRETIRILLQATN